MRTFEQVKAFGRVALDAADLNKVEQHPGPDLPDIPQEYVLWTRYGGPGINTEVDDLISWQARSVGAQGDYNSAETIADVIDMAMITFYSRKVGDIWVSGIQRVGGAPTALLTDEADRTHFVCSYIASVELALPT